MKSKSTAQVKKFRNQQNKKNTKFHWRTQNYSDLLDFTFPNDTSMKVNVLNSFFHGLSYRYTMTTKLLWKMIPMAEQQRRSQW